MLRPAPLIERYRDRLPLEPGDPVVTLNEGSTPLIEAPRLSERIGARAYLKFEGANPTGSFKDRGMTVAVSRAKGRGAEAVICASTGNTAASAAAYAARAGMRGAVIVPEGKIAIGKLAQALMHGARVVALQGNFDDALRIVRELAEQAPDRAGQLGQPVPDRGPEDRRLRGRRGARRGARRAGDPGRQRRQRHRLLARLPGARRRRRSLYGFQAEGAAPLVARRARSPNPETVASAIRIGNPARWEEAMDAFTASRGRVAAVSDEQILDAYRWLAASEGVFCEPASAASVAGLLAHGLPVVEGARRPSRSSACSPATASRTPTRRSRKAPAGDQLRERPQRGRARRCSIDRAAADCVRVPASSANLGPGLRRDGGGGLAAPRAGGGGDRGSSRSTRAGSTCRPAATTCSCAPSRACTPPTASPSGCAARSRWRAASAPARRRSSPASSPPTTSSSWRSPRRRCWRGRASSRAIPTTSPPRSTAAS